MYIYIFIIIPVYVCFVFAPLLLNTVVMLLHSLYFVISTSVHYVYIYNYIYISYILGSKKKKLTYL